MSRIESVEFVMREDETAELTARERCDELLFHLTRTVAQAARDEQKDASEVLGEWLGRLTYELTGACLQDEVTGAERLARNGLEVHTHLDPEKLVPFTQAVREANGRLAGTVQWMIPARHAARLTS